MGHNLSVMYVRYEYEYEWCDNQDLICIEHHQSQSQHFTLSPNGIWHDIWTCIRAYSKIWMNSAHPSIWYHVSCIITHEIANSAVRIQHIWVMHINMMHRHQRASFGRLKSNQIINQSINQSITIYVHNHNNNDKVKWRQTNYRDPCLINKLSGSREILFLAWQTDRAFPIIVILVLLGMSKPTSVRVPR